MKKKWDHIMSFIFKSPKQSLGDLLFLLRFLWYVQQGSTLTVVRLPGASEMRLRASEKRHQTCPIGQVKMILWYVQFLKSKMINIELFSVGSRGKYYLNIESYVSCILRHFVFILFKN
jgi:hypothetical protein